MKLRKLGALVLAFGLLVGCTSGSDTKESLTIVTTFFPLYDLARTIAGDDVEVVNLMESGVSAHDYEPSVQDRIKIESADVFVYNGAGMEGWVDKTLESMNVEKLKVVDTSKNVSLLESDHNHDHEEEGHDHEEESDDHEHEEGHDHDHGVNDPHIWLDPVNAKAQAQAIFDALVAVDPDHKSEYQSRYDALAVELDQLDTLMKTGMETAVHKHVVMNHSAFSYMAHRYGFDIESISGIIPESEPSATQLTSIMEFIEHEGITSILMESTSNQKVIDVIVNATGVKVLPINTLESVDDSKTASYVAIMKANIESILSVMK